MGRLANPPPWELYDLQDDPMEFHNRSGDTRLEEVESRLKASFAALQQETGDHFGDPEFRR